MLVGTLIKFPLVYAFGSGDHGQLGNGRTGEHIITGNKTGYDIMHEPGMGLIPGGLWLC